LEAGIAQSTAPQPAGSRLTHCLIAHNATIRLCARPPKAIIRHPAPPVERIRGKVYRTRNPKGISEGRSRKAKKGRSLDGRITELSSKLKITEEGRSGSSKNCVRGFAALKSFRPYSVGTARRPLRRVFSALRAGSRQHARTAGNGGGNESGVGSRGEA
jgi:hypothetical protein